MRYRDAMLGQFLGNPRIPVHRRVRKPYVPKTQQPGPIKAQAQISVQPDPELTGLARRGMLKRRYKALAGQPSRRTWTNEDLEREITNLLEG